MPLSSVFFLMFLGVDNFLLTTIVFDCFVAICHPLNYTVIMNPRLCVLLVLMSWLLMFWASLIHILLLNRLTFSSGTEIPHFFCELAQLLKVAGSDALANNIFTYVATALLCVFPMTGILFSYVQIVSSLTRMSSIKSKYKAFSTCVSHLGVISLYYGRSLLEYLGFTLTHSSQGITVTSVMYTVVTPMLNPFIYSLRNMDVMGPLGRLFIRAASSH
ncbi:Olfactory receptor 867 [Sciurus carolinensis]|uniref:Olfactory receptor 867 n=1 Tax=Sciurus carolinensis TaxID=30640 RepID=A0AA41MY93_SCICA|nr:Olfactory receptor 867 [Sciurus carolinensis]